MMKVRKGILTPTVAALAAVFAIAAIAPAQAQERKSIRWATSNTGSYGYKVAASMV